MRGNGKIIQELEAAFRGAGWNVIKVIWGSDWDPLLEARQDRPAGPAHERGRRRRVPEVHRRARRLHPRALLRQVPRAAASWSSTCRDEQLRKLRRGGHDPVKVYAAYKAAVEHQGSPTVILAKTIKGYGLGEAGEGRNVTHQQKKLNEDELRVFRDRFDIPISDDEVAEAPFYQPADDSPRDRVPAASGAAALGGRVPARKACARSRSPMPQDERLGPLRRGGRPRRLDHHGLRPDADPAHEGQGDRQADRADHPRRGPHLRHGVAVPAVRHLLQRRPALRAGRQGDAALLPRGQGRPDPGRGHHRGGLDGRRSSPPAPPTPPTAST